MREFAPLPLFALLLSLSLEEDINLLLLVGVLGFDQMVSIGEKALKLS